MSEVKINIYDAMICVMKEVKNIEKSMTIGVGQNSYKGISDKDVKQKIGEAMAKNNLVCFPIKIEPTTRLERWEEIDNYSKTMKTKQSVFTEVLVTYKIVHSLTSENIEIQGFGYGIDAQDKGAGKATTYALKNALLYTFLVPTGTIEDTDKTHSDDMKVIPIKTLPICSPALFEKAITRYEGLELDVFDKLKTAYTLTAQQQLEISEITKR